MDRATGDLTTESGRAPTAAELAERVGSTVEVVLETRQAVTARRAVSLDQPTGDDERGEALGTLVGTDETGFEGVERSAVLDSLLQTLTERERLIVRLRFVEDLTQAEIGQRVGLSQMHVSRLLRASIARLQDAAGD